jgi:hypothetical protein
MWHAWNRGEKCTKFWWGSLKERDTSEDQGVGGTLKDIGNICSMYILCREIKIYAEYE